MLVRVVTPETTDDGETIFIVEQVQDPDLAPLYGLELDPDNRFSQTDATGEPIEDLARVDAWLTSLDTAHLTYGVIDDRQGVFAANAQSGLDFLLTSQDLENWIPSGVSARNSDRAWSRSEMRFRSTKIARRAR